MSSKTLRLGEQLNNFALLLYKHFSLSMICSVRVGKCLCLAKIMPQKIDLLPYSTSTQYSWVLSCPDYLALSPTSSLTTVAGASEAAPLLRSKYFVLGLTVRGHCQEFVKFIFSKLGSRIRLLRSGCNRSATGFYVRYEIWCMRRAFLGFRVCCQGEDCIFPWQENDVSLYKERNNRSQMKGLPFPEQPT
jgi:hypothetical protein